jgi:hypothetical protein
MQAHVEPLSHPAHQLAARSHSAAAHWLDNQAAAHWLNVYKAAVDWLANRGKVPGGGTIADWTASNPVVTSKDSNAGRGPAATGKTCPWDGKGH